MSKTLGHVHLGNDSLSTSILDAATEVYKQGGSPREQIDASRRVSGLPLVYMPHVGMKEKLKAARRAERMRGNRE